MDQSSRCYFQTSDWFYVKFSAFFSKLLLNNGTLYYNVDSASSAQITRQKSLPNFCIYNCLIALIKPRIIQGFYSFGKKFTEVVEDNSAWLFQHKSTLSCSCSFCHYHLLFSVLLNALILQITSLKQNPKVVIHLGPSLAKKIHTQSFKQLGIFGNTFCIK